MDTACPLCDKPKGKPHTNLVCICRANQVALAEAEKVLRQACHDHAAECRDLQAEAARRLSNIILPPDQIVVPQG